MTANCQVKVINSVTNTQILKQKKLLQENKLHQIRSRRLPVTAAGSDALEYNVPSSYSAGL